MVGVLTLREIAVILTAVMVAGRSGSAFTAELGSMKMREEIDALKVTGLDPVEVLVVPRVLALMLALPILVFVADLAAIFGAAIVCNAYADIPTATFLNRLHGAVGFKTFFVGVTKAPFMAMIIAMVSCLEGLQVAGSAESLGRHTTMAVVKSIFIVILVDGIFAMFYAAVGGVTMAGTGRDQPIIPLPRRDRGLRRETDPREPRSRREGGRDPRFRRRVGHRQVGADAHHSWPQTGAVPARSR